MPAPFLSRNPNPPGRNHLIGMVHTAALPGTPRDSGDLSACIARAVEEASALRDCGFDAVLLENMHDRPYLRGAVGPEIVAAMAAVSSGVRAACPELPLGIQILAGANREAVAVAHAAGLDFVRVEGFVFAHVADEGIIEGCAGELLRYRKAIGAENVAIFADIKKKHSSHAITSDVDIAETAKAVEFFLGDGVIVTGSATGSAACMEDVAKARRALSAPLPLLVGSGITPENAHSYLRHADALIVGSSIKKEGKWENALDLDVAKRLVELALEASEAGYSEAG